MYKSFGSLFSAVSTSIFGTDVACVSFLFDGKLLKKFIHDHEAARRKERKEKGRKTFLTYEKEIQSM